MAKLRHIALWVRDLEASARFYENVFELKRVGAETIALGSGIYLSDGVVNLALLRMADADEKSYVGTHHFGFVVDNLDETKALIEAHGGKFHMTLGDPSKSNFESKFKDPDGIIFDISKHGWDGIS
jgi:catechol 2,3-dioxygenase-like lactoylglutathione lyase family enzyme